MLESFGVQPYQTRHRPLGSNVDRPEVAAPPKNQERPFRPQVVEHVTYEEEEFVELCELRPIVIRRYQDAN